MSTSEFLLVMLSFTAAVFLLFLLDGRDRDMRPFIYFWVLPFGFVLLGIFVLAPLTGAPVMVPRGSSDPLDRPLSDLIDLGFGRGLRVSSLAVVAVVGLGLAGTFAWRGRAQQRKRRNAHPRSLSTDAHFQEKASVQKQEPTREQELSSPSAFFRESMTYLAVALGLALLIFVVAGLGD